MLTVFIHGGCSDALESASGKGGLKYIGRIHSPLGAAGADNCVYLVYEKNNILDRLNLFDQVLEPLLELAPEFGASHQRAHIYNHYAFLKEHIGSCPLGNPVGKPLYNGSLSHTRLSDKHRVVLPASGQNMHKSVYLGLTSDYRIKLSGRCHQNQVSGKAVQHRGFTLYCFLNQPKPPLSPAFYAGLPHAGYQHRYHLYQKVLPWRRPEHGISASL